MSTLPQISLAGPHPRRTVSSRSLAVAAHRLTPNRAVPAVRLADTCVVLRSPLLQQRQSPTGKVYQGLLGFGPSRRSPGQYAWIAAGAYGPGHAPGSQASVVYDGPSLEAACRAIEARLWQKLDKGYEPVEPGSLSMDPDQVAELVLEHAGPDPDSGAAPPVDALAELLEG